MGGTNESACGSVPTGAGISFAKRTAPFYARFRGKTSPDPGLNHTHLLKNIERSETLVGGESQYHELPHTERETEPSGRSLVEGNARSHLERGPHEEVSSRGCRRMPVVARATRAATHLEHLRPRNAGVADGGMALAAECIHQKRPPALSCNGEAGGSVGSGGVGVSTGFQTW